MEINVKHVWCMDWEGLYFNDELVSEGHSFSAALVLQMLVGKTELSYKLLAMDEEWMEDVVNLPHDFKYVVLVGTGE